MDVEGPEEEGRAVRAEAELLRAGRVEALDLDDPEATRAWAACDLASMVEGCFGETLDPGRLDAAEAERWLDRLGESYLPPGFADDSWMTRYLWLVDRDERVGTIALPATAVGALDLRVWSLYVRPRKRGRGLATGALEAAYGAALGAGFRGIRLDTHWVWRRALSFYLARRMWVTSWKRSIGLCWWPSLPAWELEERPGAVTLRVRARDGWAPLHTARREGERLGWTEHESAGASSEERFLGRATLAVVLATRGWPLSGAGMDELAAAIARFEAVARDRGWRVSAQ